MLRNNISFRYHSFHILYQSTSNNFHQAVIPTEKHILTAETLPIQKEHFKIGLNTGSNYSIPKADLGGKYLQREIPGTR